MNRLRPVIMMLGLAVLLVNTGDCVNLVFADAKGADCCLRADCPFAAAAQMDSCCKGPASPGQYLRTPIQQSISQPPVTSIDFPVDVLANPIPARVGNFVPDRNFESPPDGLNTLFIPLLI